jgi:O-methyltransferase
VFGGSTVTSPKAYLRSLLHPLRVAAGRFVVTSPDTDGPSVISDAVNANIIYKAAQITSAEHVPGDYLEFGVFRGTSFIKAFHTIKQVYERRASDPDNIHTNEYRRGVAQCWEDFRFFAFDSFQGLPKVEGIDTQSSDFTGGKFSCSLDSFLGNIRQHGVDTGRVVAVPGWFKDSCSQATLAKHNLKAASIIHIDCDLYESARTVLEFISPLLVDGTVLIFDDWYCYRGNPNAGEQRAFREWTAQMTGWLFTEYQKEGPWRNSFIASRVS